MYNNKFVASIKCDGKILREIEDTVYVPFGSEYSLIFKNLNTRKAVVDVTIDGRKAIVGLIIEPNSTTELERFMDDSKKGHRFKFIEKTDQISDHRGDQPDDGLVRVEFRFEKQKICINRIVEIWNYPIHRYPPPVYQYPLPIYYDWTNNTDRTDGVYSKERYTCCSNSTLSTNIPKVAKSNEGITVNGSISKQEFSQGWTDELEGNSDVVILRLKGKINEKRIGEPITVKTKTECKICGNKHKSGTKFCSNCGTSLEII